MDRGQYVDGGSVSRLRAWRAAGTIALVSLMVLSIAAKASAEPLAMEFTEARANVGQQLFADEDVLFEPPKTAPFEADIDPESGLISAGDLQVPQFSTHIDDPIDANVTVDFDIGVITGSFAQGTGALELSGTAGGILSADYNGGKQCVISTTPASLTLSTAGSSGGGESPSGTRFANGLTGSGAIAGQWTDMNAAPVDPNPGGDSVFCADVEEEIGGPGGIWIAKGDVVPPPAPQLTGTDPPSPAWSGTPRILGNAEDESTVRIYAGPSCAGAPVATASAGQLDSPGIQVAVEAGATAVFSATPTPTPLFARSRSPIRA